MWRGYENVLMSYQYAICIEWTRRGYNDTCLDKTLALFQSLPRNRRQPRNPPWLGKKKVHSTYRKNLLAKKPEWYSRYGWPESPSFDRYYPLEIQ
ncbi:pyrimidine dimer DNA glycosylase/endonuclease V [Aurantimicrobium sp.]|uniref:pyrimidine dimer DNA glycosylase/endonuclease V n=1 Tax=Aurantimicrobium sp. TaxID=1930784 RepID=UPI003FA550DE